MTEITLHVNGETHSLDVEPETPLLFVLRNQLGLSGSKLGCGLEQCGACAVLVDDESQLSCSTPAVDFDGRRITTVEGLADSGQLSKVQEAFVAAGAAQCGYCTPGMVIAVTALLNRHARPDDDDILTALAPHLCRCGTHPRVLRAVARLTGRDMP